MGPNSVGFDDSLDVVRWWLGGLLVGLLLRLDGVAGVSKGCLRRRLRPAGTTGARCLQFLYSGIITLILALMKFTIKDREATRSIDEAEHAESGCSSGQFSPAGHHGRLAATGAYKARGGGCEADHCDH